MEACPTHLMMLRCHLSLMNFFLLVVGEEVDHPLGNLVDNSLIQWLAEHPMEAYCLVEEGVMGHPLVVVVGSYHSPSWCFHYFHS